MKKLVNKQVKQHLFLNQIKDFKAALYIIFYRPVRFVFVLFSQSFYVAGWTLRLVLSWGAGLWSQFEVWVSLSLRWACKCCNYDISESLRSRLSCLLVLSRSLIVCQLRPIRWEEALRAVSLTRREMSWDEAVSEGCVSHTCTDCHTSTT